MVDTAANICMETSKIKNCNYLQECVSNLKDSKVNLLITPMSTSDISLERSNLDDINLININFNFMSIENSFVQNAEEFGKCTSKKEEKQKENSIDINSSESTGSSNSVNTNCNIFVNFWRKESNYITKIINNGKFLSNRDLIIQCSHRKQIIDYYDYFTNFFTDNDIDNDKDIDQNTNKNNNCISQNVTSGLKLGIRIENQLRNGQQIQKCGQCLMTFRYKRHLDRHLEGHQKNNCPHCNEKFARRKHLAIHLFRAHGERIARYPYFCDMCNKNFPKQMLLNHHRAKHNYENGKVCSECGDMINTNEKEHKENQCRKRQFICQQCSQTFSIEQTYLSHIENHNNYKCPNCNAGFASKRKAQEHFRAVHTAKLDPDSANNGKY
jgi:KRAB domain-containing zinc finger protein